MLFHYRLRGARLFHLFSIFSTVLLRNGDEEVERFSITPKTVCKEPKSNPYAF